MTRVVEDFTVKVPRWRPRVAPVDLESATQAQRDALKVTPSNTKVSDYVLVLANDVETLAVRTPLFNAIMYDKGGLSRAERELGALGASVVNHCVYCAAVHASRYNQLAKENDTVAAIFADGEGTELGGRAGAIFRFAVKLSQTPPQVGVEDVAALRDAGLDMAEILDLVLSSALFGWANRLMHTLGDPVTEEPAA
ncbi:MAG: peroxidase-related enzyme [Pseudomonadota bacterium]